jgi:vacuolar protein sorting-associated protein 13A/C
LKNSVFGLTDSLSKVTGSLGKGLAMATMDKKFQDRRRMKMTRNKPQHAIFGVTQGVTYLGTSLASGVVGLVKRPMEGTSESGVGGFFGGVGKGLVGQVPYNRIIQS